MTTHILLLAAGSSSRMGQPKQLLNVAGEPLLVRAVKTALATSPYVTVVIGAHAADVRRVLDDYPVHVVENESWKKGMGSSLKTGVAAIQAADPPADALLVMLCDQPKVTVKHLRKLIDQNQESKSPVTASGYNQILGVPAVFSQELFAALLQIGDETGASTVIRENRNATVVVDFPEGAVDLDTPEDLSSYLGQPRTSE